MDPRQLREATRMEHEATEALMPLGDPNLTRTGYVNVLQTLAPLIEGWETWAEQKAPEELRELLARRKRSHLLRADLAYLGAETAVAPAETVDWDAVVQTSEGTPVAAGDGADGRNRPGEFAAAFLGAVYVMEGSTLGGRFIARQVESVLGLHPGQGDAYFQGHGEQTGALWREVTARIAAVTEEHAPVLIGGAQRTFRAFGQALAAGDAVSPFLGHR